MVAQASDLDQVFRGETQAATDYFPSSSILNLRVSVMTNVVPLAFQDETSTIEMVDDEDPLSTFYGFQPDLLRALRDVAWQVDGVRLNLTVSAVERPYDYNGEIHRIARDCNTSAIPAPQHLCDHVDMVIGDYYPRPNRTLHARPTTAADRSAAPTSRRAARGAERGRRRWRDWRPRAPAPACGNPLLAFGRGS